MRNRFVPRVLRQDPNTIIDEATENFDPEAFMLRRSMPWAEGLAGGLNFVAFGKPILPKSRV